MSDHVEMTEVRVEHIGTPRETTIERPIYRYCWHEGPDGNPRRQDWPCEAVRWREALMHRMAVQRLDERCEECQQIAAMLESRP